MSWPRCVQSFHRRWNGRSVAYKTRVIITTHCLCWNWLTSYRMETTRVTVSTVVISQAARPSLLINLYYMFRQSDRRYKKWMLWHPDYRGICYFTTPPVPLPRPGVRDSDSIGFLQQLENNAFSVFPGSTISGRSIDIRIWRCSQAS